MEKQQDGTVDSKGSDTAWRRALDGLGLNGAPFPDGMWESLSEQAQRDVLEAEASGDHELVWHGRRQRLLKAVEEFWSVVPHGSRMVPLAFSVVGGDVFEWEEIGRQGSARLLFEWCRSLPGWREGLQVQMPPARENHAYVSMGIERSVELALGMKIGPTVFAAPRSVLSEFAKARLDALVLPSNESDGDVQGSL